MCYITRKRPQGTSTELLYPALHIKDDKLQIPARPHGDDLHARGAVDAEDLAVDPLAVLGGEEADDAGNVDGKTDAVERGPAGGELGRDSIC